MLYSIYLGIHNVLISCVRSDMIVLGSHGISWLQTGKNVAEEQDGGHVVSRLLRSNLVTGRSRLVVNEKVGCQGVYGC